MMARLLVLACVSFLFLACISAKRNGGPMEETGLAGLQKQQQKMVGEIETIHNAVTKLKLDMKTLLKKASKTDEAVTGINMIDQLLAGAVNTGQLNSRTRSDGSTNESSDLSDDEMGASMRHRHSQPSTSSDFSDDEMGTNMRPSHSQSAGATRKDHYTWTMERGLKLTQGEPVDKREKDTDAYQLPSSGDDQTQTEGSAGRTSPDTGDDDKQS